MLAVHPRDLPAESLLQRCRTEGAYTDCYSTTLDRSVSFAEYVEAFYTTPAFRLERHILRWLASRPSTDGEVGQLARGETAVFAAWAVEDRCPDQLLLRDYTGRTCSWLMCEAIAGGASRLLFGSAVLPAKDRRGEARLGSGYSALLGFHKAYSQVLLASARRRLRQHAPSTS